MELIQNAYTFCRQSKSLLLLLFWKVSISFVYRLVFNSSVYLRSFNDSLSIYIAVIIALIFLCTAPLASFVADVKCGRFKTLLFSTAIIILSNTFIVVGLSGLFFAIHSFGNLYQTFLAMILAGILPGLCGIIFFLGNFLQFGTDQLRDAPTRQSIVFLCAVYWCDSFINLLTLCTSLPGHKIIIDPHENALSVDKLNGALIVTTAASSVALSVLLVVVIYRKRHWLETEHIVSNPYLLIWSVIKFAAHHRKPIRRSAFTYCESAYPSRLDFGKQRYGGPFTTEQVEDVKTLFNILKVLLCLGAVFFLEQCTTYRHAQHYFFLSFDDWKEEVLKEGVVSSALAVIFVPLLTKCFLSRYFPSMFKRIGFSIVCLLLVFVMHIAYDISNSSSSSSNSPFFLLDCRNFTENNSSNFYSSSIIFLLIENVIQFVYGVLLYVSVWEFISCQSPQHMKGLLFGLLYAVRAFHQLLADFTIFMLDRFIRDVVICNRSLYFLNVAVAIVLVIIFITVSQRYRKRKRDDICNVYQYAENYYSYYGSVNNELLSDQ